MESRCSARREKVCRRSLTNKATLDNEEKVGGRAIATTNVSWDGGRIQVRTMMDSSDAHGGVLCHVW
ncbi:hypothetical protein L484_018474 [Morus notabilis]|uniref:Uncharacterized protein n=1 Tax=Morus notabilis TaxID=981085 RepID=W9SBJ9_9ROSA|nr:hypothetical protein L484_018474 [Morus notabilis]